MDGMRFTFIHAVVICGSVAGCAGQSPIKPAEVLDQHTGMTVGALQKPLEFVEYTPHPGAATAVRMSFAYLGPVEWDRMGEITYGLWIHVAPGNDKKVGDIRARGAVVLKLDDGPLALAPADTPSTGHGPYKPVASWGQTSYYELSPAMLKRMAASRTLILHFQSIDGSSVDFLPSHETHGTLTEFLRTRGITDD